MKKFFNNLATAILIIVLFISTTLLLLLIPLKNTISGGSVKKMISNLEIEKMVNENPTFKQSVDEALEPILTETNKLGIDDEVIIKIVDSDEVKDLMGDVTENLIDYAITGKNQKIINIEDINKLVNDAIDEINKSGYYEINETQKKEILNIAQNKVEEYEELIPDANIIDEKLNKELTKEEKNSLNSIRFVLGNKLLTYIIISIIVSILLIALLKFKKAKFIKYASITILISSICTSLITLVLVAANNVLFKFDYPYIFDIIKKGINFSFALSLSVFAISIIVLIIYKIINSKFEKEVA